MSRYINYISSIIQESSLTHSNTDDIKKQLTSSELKIINQIAKYQSSQEIADNLFISIRTVEKHRNNIIKKLGLSNNKSSLQQFVIENKEKFMINKKGM